MEVSLAFALLNEAVIKPTAQGIIDDFKKGLEEDFETIYKPKGLDPAPARNEIRRSQSLRVVAITLLLKQLNKKYLFISYPF